MPSTITIFKSKCQRAERSVRSRSDSSSTLNLEHLYSGCGLLKVCRTSPHVPAHLLQFRFQASEGILDRITKLVTYIRIATFVVDQSRKSDSVLHLYTHTN